MTETSLIERQGNTCRHAVNLTEAGSRSGPSDEIADAWDVAADAAEEDGDTSAAETHRARAMSWRPRVPSMLAPAGLLGDAYLRPSPRAAEGGAK